MSWTASYPLRWSGKMPSGWSQVRFSIFPSAASALCNRAFLWRRSASNRDFSHIFSKMSLLCSLLDDCFVACWHHSAWYQRRKHECTSSKYFFEKVASNFTGIYSFLLFSWPVHCGVPTGQRTLNPRLVVLSIMCEMWMSFTGTASAESAPKRGDHAEEDKENVEEYDAEFWFFSASAFVFFIFLLMLSLLSFFLLNKAFSVSFDFSEASMVFPVFRSSEVWCV